MAVSIILFERNYYKHAQNRENKEGLVSGVACWIYFKEFWIGILLNQRNGQRYWTLVCSTEDPQAHEMNIEEVAERYSLGKNF